MVLKESKVDKIWGVICVVFGLILFLLIIPTQIKSFDMFPWFNSAKMMPNLYAGLFIFLGICLFLQGIKKAKVGGAKDPDMVTLNKHEMLTLLIFVVTVAVYIVLLDVLPIHYCIVTAVFMAILMWFCGQRKILIIVAVSVILPVLIYIGFYYGLHIRFM